MLVGRSRVQVRAKKTSRSNQGKFLTERRTLANATRIERIETKQISGWYLL